MAPIFKRYLWAVLAAFSCFLLISLYRRPKATKSLRPKFIIDWTGFYSENMVQWWRHFARECPHLNNSCVFSTNRSLVEDADAVIFHARQPGWTFDDMPKTRCTNQRYIVFLRETPPYTFLDFKAASGVFNWTMTHRVNSDIWWPGGKIMKLEKDEKPEFSWQQMQDMMENKTKLVAWWASNCDTHSKRELYVSELQKYIPVDVYGACGNLSCTTDTIGCRQLLRQNYHFYLSFENSMCTDFVTEKFYERIQDFVVPVVLRASDYRKMGPDGTPRSVEKSFIAADDFKSAKDLAEFLQNLAADRDKYLEYHKWRLQWKARDYFYQSYSNPPLCILCQMLHSDLPAKSKTDLYEWWFDGNCEGDFAKRIM